MLQREGLHAQAVAVAGEEREASLGGSEGLGVATDAGLGHGDGLVEAEVGGGELERGGPRGGGVLQLPHLGVGLTARLEDGGGGAEDLLSFLEVLERAGELAAMAGELTQRPVRGAHVLAQGQALRVLEGGLGFIEVLLQADREPQAAAVGSQPGVVGRDSDQRG